MIAAKAVAFGEALEPGVPRVRAAGRRERQGARRGAASSRGFAIVSGGTDTHLMLVDLRPRGSPARRPSSCSAAAGITVNKNTIPDDPQSPFVTSGIRLGTPALTTRGMGTAEMRASPS